MSKMVTRCPQCQTSFRVTEEHLKIANGAVRCGSCLHVFQAKDHWVTESPAAPQATVVRPAVKPGEPTARPTTATSSMKPIATPSFLQAADKQAKATPTPAAPAGKFQFDQSAIDSAKPKGKFSFDQSAIDSASAAKLLQEPDKRIPETALTRAHQPPAAPQKSVAEIGDDELISDDMDIDDDADVVPVRKPAPAVAPPPPPPPAAQAPAFGGEDDDYSSLFEEEADVTPVAASEYDDLLDGDLSDLEADFENAPDDSMLGEEEPDDSWAKELLDELEDEPASGAIDDGLDDEPEISFINPVDADVARRDLGLEDIAPVRPTASSSASATEVRPAVTPPPVRQRQPSVFGPVDEPPPAKAAQAQVPPASTPRQASQERAELIAHIEPAPVELVAFTQHDKEQRQQQLAQAAICFALLLLLAAQAIFFNFRELARLDTTRPVLEALCSVLPCKLPPSQRWRHIRISNMVVRPHANLADALLVDAIVTNHASRELPFPQLELYFNDIDQLPVASRRLEPAEYLAGEMAGKNMIPPGQPVHIAILVKNPGAKAVNWRMDVTPFD